MKPPPGFESWLDYAVENMPTRDLYNNNELSDTPWWPERPFRDQMVKAAREELYRMRTGHPLYRRMTTFERKAEEPTP